MAEPKLRFPEFKDSWKEHKFCDFTYAAGKRNKENLPLEPYSITNIDGFIAQSDAHDEFGYMKDTDRSAYIIVQPQSFGYNPARINVGSLGFYSGKQDVIVSSLYEVFKTTDVIDDNFLEQWFKTHTFQNWIERLQEGSVRQYFYYDKLCECRLHVPCIDEQKKISETIKGIDNLITVLVEELRLWEEKKKGIMQKIFSQEVRFKDENGEDYPEWQTSKLGELGSFDKGKILSKADIAESGIPMILYGELYTSYSEVAYKIQRKTEHEIDGLYLSKGGEVILPCSGETPEDISTATCVMVSGVALGGDLIIFTPYKIDGRIISYILNHQQKYKIASVAQGKSIVHISANSIKKLDISYPVSVKEQQKIADCLSSIDEVIVIKKQKLEIWKNIKKGLLQQMFV